MNPLRPVPFLELFWSHDCFKIIIFNRDFPQEDISQIFITIEDIQIHNKLTAKEKLEESKTFLDLINNEKNNLKTLRHYVSAFLTPVRSITDHMLQEANEQLHVGIKDYQDLRFSDFKLLVEKQKNQKGIDFSKWLDAGIETLSYPPLDMVRDAINKNLHRKEILLELSVSCTPKKMLDYEKPDKMILEKTGNYKHFDTVDEIMYATEFARKEYLKRINAERKKRGDRLENEIVPKIMVNFPNIYGIQLQEWSMTLFTIMEMFVSEFSNYKKKHWS